MIAEKIRQDVKWTKPKRTFSANSLFNLSEKNASSSSYPLCQFSNNIYGVLTELETETQAGEETVTDPTSPAEEWFSQSHSKISSKANSHAKSYKRSTKKLQRKRNKHTSKMHGENASVSSNSATTKPSSVTLSNDHCSRNATSLSYDAESTRNCSHFSDEHWRDLSLQNDSAGNFYNAVNDLNTQS